MRPEAPKTSEALMALPELPAGMEESHFLLRDVSSEDAIMFVTDRTTETRWQAVYADGKWWRQGIWF